MHRFGKESWRKNVTWRSRRKSDSNIKMDFKEIRWGSLKWIYLLVDKDNWRDIVKMGMKFRIS